jgi:hypothetical protein
MLDREMRILLSILVLVGLWCWAADAVVKNHGGLNLEAIEQQKGARRAADAKRQKEKRWCRKLMVSDIYV